MAWDSYMAGWPYRSSNIKATAKLDQPSPHGATHTKVEEQEIEIKVKISIFVLLPQQSQ